MAIRIRPFQNYEEHDLINMYALEPELANEDQISTGSGDIGVLVTISKADLDNPTIMWEDKAYLGKTKAKHLGTTNLYPINPLQFKPAKKGDVFFGVTLWQTCKYDDNGEKLINKRDLLGANHAVLPGQTVPVLTRGWLDFSLDCFEVDDEANPGINLNTKLTLATNTAGKFAVAEEGDEVIGIVRAKGTSQNEEAQPYYRVQFGIK